MALIHAGLRSAALGRGVSCDIILPQKSTKLIGMETASGERLRVLWLLHGMSDDCTIWQRRTSIERYVAPYGLAVVMPDVELSSYSNLVHGGLFYDYVAHELPEVLSGMFGFSRAREDNFIAGLSMGGAGCMKIGLANPERYAAIGCLSAGAVNHPLPVATHALDPMKHRYAYIRFDGRELEGTEEDVFGNARRIVEEGLPCPRIYHSIGSSDPLLPAAHETRNFFRSLEGDPFEYTYEEDPGEHTWDYWDEHICRFLEFALGQTSAAV